MAIFQQFVSGHLDIVHSLLSEFKISHQTLQDSTAASTVIVKCNEMISEDSLQLKHEHDSTCKFSAGGIMFKSVGGLTE